MNIESSSRIVSAVLHVPAFIDDVVGSDNHIIPGVEPAIHERTGDDGEEIDESEESEWQMYKETQTGHRQSTRALFNFNVE